MIKDIIELLKTDDWHDGGQLTQFAKGKYKVPQNLTEFKNYFKLQDNG
jgi:hypothetical protein